MEEVQLVLLRGLRLHHHMQLLLKGLDVGHPQGEFPLKVVDLVLQYSPVGVVRRPQVPGLLLGCLSVGLALLQLPLLAIELLRGLALPFQPSQLRSPEAFHLLQGLPIDPLTLSIVLLQSPVLKGKFLHFLAHQVVVRRGHFSVLVSLQDVDLPLKLVVLPVQEVNLALQFDHALLVLLVLVLQVDLLKILHGRVQIVETQDLLVADLDLALELLDELLLGGEALLHLVHHLVQLLTTVISLSHFLGPLGLLPEEVLLDLHAHGDGAGARRIHFAGLLHGIGKLHTLSLLQQVRFLLTVELTQSFNNLVLTRQVNTLQILLHLRFELRLLLFKTSDSLIL